MDQKGRINMNYGYRLPCKYDVSGLPQCKFTGESGRADGRWDIPCIGGTKCNDRWNLGLDENNTRIVPNENQTPIYFIPIRRDLYFTYDSILRGTTQKFQFIENVQENFENKEEITWKQQTNSILQRFANQSTLPPSNGQLDNQEISTNIHDYRLSMPQNLMPNLQENHNFVQNSNNQFDNQEITNELNNFNNFVDYRLKLPTNMIPQINKNF
jgi:hypothetical protein